MRHLSRRFGTLRWRLMLSFFVAVWAGMMTLALLFFFVPAVVAMTSPQRPVALVQDLQALSPRLAPALSQMPPDTKGLATTLATLTHPMLVSENISDSQRATIEVVPGQNAILIVYGSDGAQLATLPARSASASDLARVQEAPEARTLLAAARHSGTPAADLITTTSSGVTLAAVPIEDSHGTIQGTLLLGVNFAALVRPMYLLSLLALIPTAILFGIIAGIFGTIFGMLTARKLTRRLGRLTAAADAWSQGDFAASARDPSPDELGQLARDLDRMAEQLRTLLQDRQHLAVAEERNRLARDLHDSVKQQLFALTMLLGSAQVEAKDNPEARRILAEAERTATTAQQEMTALIRALRPVALSRKDVATALRDLCAGWSARTGIPCDAQIPDALPMMASAEQEVYRTAEEALSNIARHSGATRVEVRAEDSSGVLELHIRDNGHGFDVGEAMGRGVGLPSMRERIEGLGGTFAVSSSVGGTRLDMRVPLSGRPQVTASARAASGESLI